MFEPKFDLIRIEPIKPDPIVIPPPHLGLDPFSAPALPSEPRILSRDDYIPGLGIEPIQPEPLRPLGVDNYISGRGYGLIEPSPISQPLIPMAPPLPSDPHVFGPGEIIPGAP